MGSCDSSNNNRKFFSQEFYDSTTKNYASNQYFNNQTFNSGRIILNQDVIVSGEVGDPSKVYQKIKQIGEGSFGKVWLVRNVYLQKNFAMKSIPKRNKIDESQIINEINILRALDHPKIMKILDFFITENYYYIITDYCPGGELYKEINNTKFKEPQAAYIIYQLLMIINYCHKMRIIHRDLKPENIMIDERKPNNFLSVKLIDFGTAKIFSENTKLNTAIGTSYYMAPEVISRNYNESCDIWSIGVIMYMLLLNVPPFPGNDDNEILTNVLKGKYDTHSTSYINLSDEAKDLMSKLLTYNPAKRINAKDALRHKWFQKTGIIEKFFTRSSLQPQMVKQMLDNIMKYKKDNIIRCACIAYLVHNNLYLEPLKEAYKLFMIIDQNKDGKITQSELEYGLVQIWGISPEEAKKKCNIIFQNIDINWDGFLEYEEFLCAAVNPQIFLNERYMKFVFDYFDTDKNGVISTKDIAKKFTSNYNNKSRSILGLIQKSIEQFDINHDGQISFSEFTRMINLMINS